MDYKDKAEGLLRVLSESKNHNTAWLLQEVLVKLKQQLSFGADPEMANYGGLYFAGYSECLEHIEAISHELEKL